MKEIKDMTKVELVEYFMDKKMKGVSFKELSNIFEKNEIDSETRKLIMNKLDEIDKKQKELLNKVGQSNKRKSGLSNLLIGIGILIFGFILYFNSAKAGVIFIFNFVVWGFGLLLVLRGLLGIIAGTVKKN